jgi:hypothetical protein
MTGTLICLAPAPMELPLLLRVALDAQQVGISRLHLADVPAPDGVEPWQLIAALRSQTELIISAAADGPLASLADLVAEPAGHPRFTASTLRRPGRDAVLTELQVSPGGGTAELVAELAAAIAAAVGLISVTGRDSAALPAMLTALAAGAHLRIGTWQTPGPNPREDVALAARAAGLARLAGRLPVRPGEARRILGLG